MSDIDVVKDMFERGIIKCRLSNLSITNCKRFKEKADFNFNFLFGKLKRRVIIVLS